MKRFLLSLFALFAIANILMAQDVIWSEDFSSYMGDEVPTGGIYAYECENGGATTKIYDSNLAGGTAPELLIAKYNGSFTATVPLNGKSGYMLLSFKTNKNLKVELTGATLGDVSKSGCTNIYPLLVEEGTKTLTIKIISESASNARFDDIILYQEVSTKPSDIQIAFCDPFGKEYQDGETMTITADVNEINEFGLKFYEASCKSPILKNKGTANANVHMVVDVLKLPINTGWLECWNGQCTPYKEATKIVTAVRNIAASASVNTEIEWDATNTRTLDPAYGETAIFVYTLYINGIKDKTVTVNFVCPSDPNNPPQNSYTATFYVDGKVYNEQIVEIGEIIVLPEPPSKEGYTFIGWEGIPETMPSHNVYIYAKFKINTYSIKYIIDGIPFKEDSIQYNALVQPIDTPQKEGYTFSGWNGLPTTMPAKDVTVTGSFTINKYKVTFINDWGQQMEIYQDFGTPIVAPGNPTKEGYTFIGWVPELDQSLPAHDVTYMATYEINSYLLKYTIDNEVVAQDSVEYGTKISPLKVTEKEGYTFSGWSEIPPTMPAKDVEVTGSFTINKYTLKYVVDGVILADTLIEYGTNILPIEEPTKEGYNFSGWSEIPQTMPAHDVTITGTFKTNTYTLTYKLDGEVYKQEYVEYLSPITSATAPEKEGYTFDGWANVPETMPAKDVIIEGSYTINQYTITFTIGKDIVYTETLNYGDSIQLPTVDAREGYTFDGWNNVPETMPAKDLVIDSKYTVNQYVIVYVIGTNVYTTQVVSYGEKLTNLIQPEEKEGYTFTGWTGVPETMPAENITLSGNYIINQYHLTYTIDNVIVLDTLVDYNSPIVPMEEPTKEGYTFSKWSDIPTTMPANDVTVTGSFTVNKYFVIYLVNNEVVNRIEVEYGQPMPDYIYTPEDEKYTFVDWIGEKYETMPAHDVVYIANITDDGIHSIKINEKDIVYTIYGVKVCPVREIHHLPAGFYYINGRKVVVK